MNNYTTKYMQQLFESINFDLFEDSLDKPGFFVLTDELVDAINSHLGEMGLFDGICIPTEKTYLIGVHERLNPVLFFDTLVHELIHVYLFEKYPYPQYNGGHGKRFKKMCEKAIDIYYPIG